MKIKELNDILASAGKRFITVTWTAKDGNSRTYNGMLVSKPSITGYVLLNARSKGIKSIDLRTIEQIKSNGKVYK
jgi:hypothetical protein